MKKMKVQALSALLVALVLVVMAAPVASAVEMNVEYKIDGSSFPIGQLAPQVFTPLSNGDVQGVTTPIILSCPGLIAFGTNGVSCAPPPYDPFGPNGWQGTITVSETVLRQLSSPDSPPPFSSFVVQFFEGTLILNEAQSQNASQDEDQTATIPLTGTMWQTQTVTGVLNEPVGVDCYATPGDPRCGAANYTGVWEIVPGSGTGGLTGISGGGTTVWQGCADPNDPMTCTLPIYQGTIMFEAGTGPQQVFLPRMQK